jgi:cell division protein ZapA (FtsZ GTPase activity inhibitor)
MSDPSAADRKVLRVVIFGQPYTLRVAGEPGGTETLAVGVDQLMNQIASRAGTTEPARIAVLAALHLADRVRQLETAAEAQDQRARRINEQIGALLDNE